MPTRAMIVVGGGTSSRFGDEKLLQEITGRPLIEHTVEAVKTSVNKCVLVARADLLARLERLGLDVDVVPGGSSRTLSEMAGLAALGREYDIIGIHDAARPLVRSELVEELFAAAAETGGAVPVLQTDELLVDRRKLAPVDGAVRVQTPQVFRGPELLAAFVRAAEAGVDAHDTVEIVHRFGSLDIAAVPGADENIKVTYPEDLDVVEGILKDPSRT